MKRLLPLLALAAVLAPPAAALGPEETLAVIRTVDDRQRNSGDYKALAYMEAKEKDKTDVVYELVVYRRDQDQKLMFLFLAPKAEQGKGYLRIAVPEGVQMFLMQQRLWLAVRPVTVAGYAAGIAAVTTVAALYPAWHAAKLKPVTAMHHIG